MNAMIKAFYHTDTSTISYVVYDKQGGHAAIIDSVLDFAAHSGKVWTAFADQQLAFIKEQQLTVDWILETHAHADHLSAAHYLREQLGSPVGVGEGIIKVQKTFKAVFHIDDDELLPDGQVFDHLFHDGELFTIGALTGKVLSTPGHTNDSVTYLIEGNAFVGDTLFMPDGGTARCDFPGGDAGVLYDSVSRLHSLPAETRLWMCHDYQPEGRELAYVTTVAESRSHNIHIHQGVDKDAFIQVRQDRDQHLDVPKLLYPSVQVNIRGGKLPATEKNGTAYIKIPLTIEPKN
ncbi:MULTISPECIES: MBL fold metallo-hydrolase [Photobacterium]|uniref:Beta-lactamase n=1 Tax=Photobacterium halotolerans TaxID=265726 RepID=A0A0F5VG17_9GAMM|nr:MULTISPECIES: MBL fold metallo-hydrolase [Photobacterium]KKD00757.1 beta-lactamase [Photobacterium halotolerans]UIP26762.1 MBL fold metallo-hydrolase [Photobacterium sp. TLY01]